jgi:hypothetical protein
MGAGESPSIGIIEYRSPGISRRRRVRSFGEELSKLAVLATTFICYSLHAPPAKGASKFFLCGALLWLGIALAAVWRWRNRDAHPRTSVPWRVLVSLFLVLTVGIFVGSLFESDGRYTCPHGMRWTNNQLGVAWSDNGGPCGNGPHPRRHTPWRIAKHWYIYRPQAW